MKDYLLNLVEQVSGRTEKINIMREYLQAYALRSMFENGAFANISFVGGTALRFIYNVPRFSEDMDFSLTKKDGYNFESILSGIKQVFENANYQLVVKYDTTKIVHAAFLKFPELMFQAGVSHRQDQNLSIKLEVDTNPPKGAIITNTLVNKYFPINFLHYDLPSLFAGKLHAIFSRPYIKGRDYFDLIWLLSKDRDLSPNIILLNNALEQTKNLIRVTSEDWKQQVCKKIETADWQKIVADVEPFSEDTSFLNSMKLEYAKTLLGRG